MKKLAKFYVPATLVNNNITHLRQLLQLINFVPIRVEFLFSRNEFEYIGFSPKFKNIAFNVEPPLVRINYRLIADKVESAEVEYVSRIN